MRFSIIIPTLNEEKSISTCLLALQGFRHSGCELIVVDGGSCDLTTALAAPLADKIMQSSASRAKQMNHGAQQANGDVLIFLHADTFLPDDALAEIERQLDSTKQWGRFNIQLQGEHFMLMIIATMMNWRSNLTGIATGDQAIFVRASTFWKAGQFPEIALMEDIALSKALKKICLPCCLQSKVISSGRRWQRNGIYKTIFLMWSLRLRYFWGANTDSLADLYAKGEFWSL